MRFQNLWWLLVAVPVLALLAVVRVWRRPYWGHSLAAQFEDEIGTAHPIWKLPRLLETAGVVCLLLALLGPVYPLTLTRVERGGLQILLVVDLSQSMEEPIEQGTTLSTSALPAAMDVRQMLGSPGSRMEAIKKSALNFVDRRPGDAIGLAVFSNNGYLVAPPTFDHESTVQYLLMTGTDALINEGYTGIGEGLATANTFFEEQKEKAGRRIRGQVTVLFTDGENNTGREPLVEIERARANGSRVYMIGVDLDEGAAQDIALAVPSTGGKYYDVRRASDLEQALVDINNVEKGVFTTVSVTRNQPAHFIFVLLAVGCLSLRMLLHAFPQFVEIS